MRVLKRSRMTALLLMLGATVVFSSWYGVRGSDAWATMRAQIHVPIFTGGIRVDVPDGYSYRFQGVELDVSGAITSTHPSKSPVRVYRWRANGEGGYDYEGVTAATVAVDSETGDYRYVAKVAFNKAGYYKLRAYHPRDMVTDEHDAEWSEVRFVKIVGLLYPPKAPESAARNTSFKAYGTLHGNHTAGTSPVRIYKFRQENGAWKSYGYVTAKAYDGSMWDFYSTRVSLPSSGTWMLRAYHVAHRDHIGVWGDGGTKVYVP